MNKRIKQKYVKMLRDKCFTGDTEQDHVYADDIICALLIELGYKDVVKVFNETERWYA